MNQFIIEYNPFAMESTLFVCRDNEPTTKMNVRSGVQALSETIVGLAYGKKIYQVAVRAPQQTAMEIAGRVSDVEQSLYSANKINVTFEVE